MSTVTLGTVVVALILIVGIGLLISLTLRAWRRRAERQAAMVGELHALPDALGQAVVPAIKGLYLGSTLEPGWQDQDRVESSDLAYRTRAVLTRYSGGIMLVRSGARGIWIPESAVIALSLDKDAAGSPAADGVLAIRWRLPSRVEIDSLFCADDGGQYETWIDFQHRLEQQNGKDTA